LMDKQLKDGKLFCCDILEGLKAIPDNSVNCVITSPPYWQLRDYGYPEQWGLEPTFNEYLEHLWSLMDEIHRILKPNGTVWINLGDTYSTQSGACAALKRCPEGGTILDPFNGSGTTTLRAEQLNRKWIGIDGSEKYSKIAKKEIEKEREQLKLNL